MRKLVVAVTVGAALVMVGPAAHGLGIPSKLKAKKVQGNLVPAYEGLAAPGGQGDDEGDMPLFIANAELRSGDNCIFEQGKFKAQVGADATVKLKGVTCGGSEYSGQLCAHTKILATIMTEDLDKDGNSTAKVCNSVGGDIAGKINFVTGNIGLLNCVAGTCDGTLQVVTDDPCPDVDKVAEIRRLEVFDGPDMTSFEAIPGQPLSTLSACCGVNQTVVGSQSVSTHAPCNAPPGSNQDVMAEMGTVTQGEAP